MDQNNELSIQVIEESINVFRGGPDMLKNHQLRTQKAMQIADSILKDWEVAYSCPDEEKKKLLLAEADARSNEFLAKCSTAQKGMMESRKAITSLMDTIKGMFTEEESKLDPKKPGPPYQIQNLRNGYSKWILEEKRRVEAEAAAEAAKAQEVADIRANFRSQIRTWCLNFLSSRKTAIVDSFNAITLGEFEEKEARLRRMDTTFPNDKFNRNLANPVFKLNSLKEVEDLKTEVLGQEEKAANEDGGFFIQYKAEIETLKAQLIDRLPSKYFELDQAEKKRIQDEKDRKEREAEIERSKGAEKKRLEAENDRKRIEAENERVRLEEEREKRENEERERLASEAKEKKRLEDEKIEMEKSAESAEAMFKQVNDTAALSSVPTAKKSFIIHVKHQAGWVELFTFWYQREGVKTPVQDLEKKTFKQIKAFAEKLAKEGEMIDSKYFSYEEDIKAINKKEKVASE